MFPANSRARPSASYRISYRAAPVSPPMAATSKQAPATMTEGLLNGAETSRRNGIPTFSSSSIVAYSASNFSA